MSDDLNDLVDGMCPRCGCCGTYWEDCGDCGGEGYLDDLYEWDPLWYDEGDTETCATCDGKGGWSMCLGHCDEHGKHAEQAAKPGAGLGKV